MAKVPHCILRHFPMRPNSVPKIMPGAGKGVSQMSPRRSREPLPIPGHRRYMFAAMFNLVLGGKYLVLKALPRYEDRDETDYGWHSLTDRYAHIYTALPCTNHGNASQTERRLFHSNGIRGCSTVISTLKSSNHSMVFAS